MRKHVNFSADTPPPGYKKVFDDGRTQRYLKEDGTAGRLVTSDPELCAKLSPPPSEPCIQRIEELERARRDAAWRLRFIRVG